MKLFNILKLCRDLAAAMASEINAPSVNPTGYAGLPVPSFNAGDIGTVYSVLEGENVPKSVLKASRKAAAVAAALGMPISSSVVPIAFVPADKADTIYCEMGNAVGPVYVRSSKALTDAAVSANQTTAIVSGICLFGAEVGGNLVTDKGCTIKMCNPYADKDLDPQETGLVVEIALEPQLTAYELITALTLAQMTRVASNGNDDLPVVFNVPCSSYVFYAADLVRQGIMTPSVFRDVATAIGAKAEKVAAFFQALVGNAVTVADPLAGIARQLLQDPQIPVAELAADLQNQSCFFSAYFAQNPPETLADLAHAGYVSVYSTTLEERQVIAIEHPAQVPILIQLDKFLKGAPDMKPENGLTALYPQPVVRILDENGKEISPYFSDLTPSDELNQMILETAAQTLDADLIARAQGFLQEGQATPVSIQGVLLAFAGNGKGVRA